jgi:tetratricopeptide (TPR) repeat protein
VNYQVYIEVAQEAARLVESGEYDSAIAIFRSLLDSDISDLDKSVMCLNMAVVHDKLGRSDEALACHDRGIAYEHSHGRFTVTEHKAAYLAEIGEWQPSLDLYEQLLKRPDLTDTDNERIRQNVVLLQAAQA